MNPPIPIVVGTVYGRLTVVSALPRSQHAHDTKKRRVRVRCECGKVQTIRFRSLHNGTSRQCTDCRNLQAKTTKRDPTRYAHLIGQTFGAWVVVSLADFKNYRTNGDSRQVLIRCQCGKERLSRVSLLRTLTTCVSCRGTPPCSAGSVHWTGGSIVSGQKWSAYKSNARHREIPFTVTREYVEDLWRQQSGRCALTGVVLYLPRQPGLQSTDGKYLASLDRIDSDLPYQPDNVQWVASVVNLMKRTMSDADLVTWARRIVVHADQQVTRSVQNDVQAVG